MNKGIRSIINIVFISVFLFLAFSSNSQTLVPANNATNVSNDMQFKLTFSANPVLQSAGNISLYKTNGTLVKTIDLASMPSGTPMSASWPWTETLNGTTIRVVPVTVDGKSVYIRFSIGAMDYSTGYYVTVDKNIFSNASTLGFNGITANNWNFTTRAKPTADLNYTVSADGTGDFATLQGAFDFLPSGTTNAKIVIKNGTYIGLAFVKGKNKFTIEGESRTGVIIKGFNNSTLNASTHWRSVVNIQGDDINIISLTMINSTPNGGTQAEVLKLNGVRCVIVNCEFYSFQDTVLIEGKVYFKDCLLEGDVDFIWGVGTVFFQSCEIRANDNGGYNVMARNDNTKHGYAFADCKITRKSTATSTQYLGRDAGASYPYAEIVYLNCTMGPHIPAVGWQINASIDASNIIFAEYKSVNESGTLISTSGRHAKSKQLTSSQNTQYRDLNWFFNGWTPVVPAYGSKDCAGVLSGSAFLDDCRICVGGTTGKTACLKDCNGVADGTATLDNCSRCVGGTTGKTACSSSSEMETEACSFDGVTENTNEGFKGSAYINVNNAVGTAISFNVTAAIAGNAIISFRYSNGGMVDRPAQISLNGVVLPNNLSFPVTTDFATWATVDVVLNFIKGNNVVKMISAMADGMANIDQIGYVSAGLTIGSCILTGLEEISSEQTVTCFPNPFSSHFVINSKMNFKYKVLDMNGMELISGEATERIEVGKELLSGIYLLDLEILGRTKKVKMVKN
jgi:pectin methylesterase-like acyl-CoA thioesterase